MIDEDYARIKGLTGDITWLFGACYFIKTVIGNYIYNAVAKQIGEKFMLSYSKSLEDCIKDYFITGWKHKGKYKIKNFVENI
jgi:hypothetical protein